MKHTRKGIVMAVVFVMLGVVVGFGSSRMVVFDSIGQTASLALLKTADLSNESTGYLDEQDSIDGATVLTTVTLEDSHTLEHRCSGKQVTNNVPHTYCIGTNYLILRRLNAQVPAIQETLLLKKIVALEPYQAPELGDVLLPKDKAGLILVTFTHVGCSTPEDPLDPCGAGMPAHNYSLALDLATGKSRELRNVFNEQLYSNDDNTAFVIAGGICGGAGCSAAPLAVYLIRQNLLIDMTTEQGVDSNEFAGGSKNGYATWSNVRWNSLTDFAVDYTDAQGKTTTMQLSLPQIVKLSK